MQSHRQPYRRLELRCRATKRSFGLFDHYFLVVGDREIHLGVYRKGKVLLRGTTKGSHLACEYDLCRLCYDRLLLEIKLKEDARLFRDYFPLLNCETLCTGFSVQSLAFLSIPFILTLLIKRMYLWAIILFLLTIVCLLAYSKYMFSRTQARQCKHLLLS